MLDSNGVTGPQDEQTQQDNGVPEEQPTAKSVEQRNEQGEWFNWGGLEALNVATPAWFIEAARKMKNPNPERCCVFVGQNTEYTPGTTYYLPGVLNPDGTWSPILDATDGITDHEKAKDIAVQIKKAIEESDSIGSCSQRIDTIRGQWKKQPE